MKTKFNFNSQICTTKEQSERLLALGLKKETADMYRTPTYESDKLICYYVPNVVIFDDHFNVEPNDLPAWSLGRLLEIMRVKASSLVVPLDNTFDRLIDGIEMRIKDGYFNKEYLMEE